MIVVVEVAYFVGAINSARPGANAAIVYLCIEPILVVVGGTHRTDGFTRCAVAVLTHHRNDIELNVWILTLPVMLPPQPFNFSAFGKRVFPNNGQIVFGLASRDASSAATALIEVDGHGPVVIKFFVIPRLAVLPPTFGYAIQETHVGITVIGMLFV